jgi:dTDP-4-amino-4,6-dideoxygalactose transaminase
MRARFFQEAVPLASLQEDLSTTVAENLKVPFLDLKAEYRSLKEDIDREVHDVLDSGRFILGEKVKGFETEFAKYLGTGHVVAVNSGTSALYLALRALKIGPGDEVITAANTFVATCEAVAMTGAMPGLVDVLPSNFNMDPDRLKEAINKKTKAVIPVHLYGLPADMDDIMRIAGECGIPVVEDAAQAHGADCKVSGRNLKAGAIGNIGCFSFYPSKNLGCYGEGGAVATNDASLASRIVMLRDHGQAAKHAHTEIGGNFRMEALQGAVLKAKLAKLDEFNMKRKNLARIYSETLTGLPITLPQPDRGKTHVYHLYVIQLDKRDDVMERLRKAGIEAAVHYPSPVHLCEAFSYLGHKAGDFPVSEALAGRVLSLPMYPQLTEEQARFTAETVAGIIA